jgi:hypothetical protein
VQHLHVQLLPSNTCLLCGKQLDHYQVMVLAAAAHAAGDA